MNKFSIMIIASLLVFNYPAFCQYISISAGTGIGTYSLGDLKKLNEDLMLGMPVATKVVNSFPPYPFFRFSALWENEKLGLGISVSHCSTGSRIHYADYSGTISMKQLIRCNSFGIPFHVKLTKKEDSKAKVYFQLEPGIVMTRDVLRQYMSVYEETVKDDYTFTSESMYALAGFSCRYQLKKVSFMAGLGYFFDTGGKLFFEGNSEQWLVDNSNDPIKSNISGLRLDISVGIRFPWEFPKRLSRQPRVRQKLNFWDWMLRYRPIPAPRPF